MKNKLLFNLSSTVPSQFLYTSTCAFQWGLLGVVSCLAWKWKAYHPQASSPQHLHLPETPAVLVLEYAKLAPVNKQSITLKKKEI